MCLSVSFLSVINSVGLYHRQYVLVDTVMSLYVSVILSVCPAMNLFIISISGRVSISFLPTPNVAMFRTIELDP